MRRAALSITNNLAEGSGRRTPASKRTFYDAAKGSTYEVISVLAIALRRKEISPAEFDFFYQAGDEVASIISGLIEATFREEVELGQTARTLREAATEYEISDDSNSQL